MQVGGAHQVDGWHAAKGVVVRIVNCDILSLDSVVHPDEQDVVQAAVVHAVRTARRNGRAVQRSRAVRLAGRIEPSQNAPEDDVGPRHPVHVPPGLTLAGW